MSFYVLLKCSPSTQELWKQRYKMAKKYGIRIAFGSITGWSLVSLIKEACYNKVKVYGKHKIGTLLFGVGVTSTTKAIPLITTATQLVKYSKAAHSLSATFWRTADNLSEITFVFIDYLLFREYVP